jgi:hypothetical protein
MPRIFDWIIGLAYVDVQSVSTLASFFLAMILHPSVQEQAAKDLRSIVSQGRLPHFNDDLPLYPCHCKGVFEMESHCPLRCVTALRSYQRRRPVLIGNIGIPHRLIEDDVAFGYHIPQGSMGVGNIWLVCLIESVSRKTTSHTSQGNTARRESLSGTANFSSGTLHGTESGTFCTKCNSGNRDTTLTLLQSSEAFQMQADTTFARSGRPNTIDSTGHAVISS